jgi:hypothetical protein
MRNWWRYRHHLRAGAEWLVHFPFPRLARTPSAFGATGPQSPRRLRDPRALWRATGWGASWIAELRGTLLGTVPVTQVQASTDIETQTATPVDPAKHHDSTGHHDRLIHLDRD